MVREIFDKLGYGIMSYQKGDIKIETKMVDNHYIFILIQDGVIKNAYPCRTPMDLINADYEIKKEIGLGSVINARCLVQQMSYDEYADIRESIIYRGVGK